MTERRIFPDTTDMAFYDRHKNRVTPWFPANELYTVDESTAGVTVHFVAIRDFDYFEGYFPASFTMTAPGATATAIIRAEDTELDRLNRILGANLSDEEREHLCR